MPVSVGHQDLAALIARQPAVTERGRQHIRTSTFGALHAASLSFPNTATFSLPRPVGTVMPEAPGYQLASLDPRALDLTGSINSRAIESPVPPPPPLEFPVVDRRLKGDRLVVPAQPQTPAAQPSPPSRTKPRKQDTAEAPPLVTPAPAPEVAVTDPVEKLENAAPVIAPPEERAAAMVNPSPATEPESPVEPPKSEARIAALPPESAPEAVPGPEPVMPTPSIQERRAEAPADMTNPALDEPLTDERPAGPGEREIAALEPSEEENAAMLMARLFFGADAVGPVQGELRPWAPGEAPTFTQPRIPADPDIKMSALTPNILRDEPPPAIEPRFKLDDIAPEKTDENETVAPKGEVTGEGRRPKTPAERLGLSGASRAKHERCLSNAIYFESRGETERGQMAVAQVVLNRAFSGHYPDNVCDVVYQNAHRHLACQFTFACDGIRDVVKDHDAWAVATRIARDSLDGKIWLPEIGKATHYHATYVSPWWVRTMKKHHTLGVHIFYRPRRWGDGAEAPVWGQMPEETTGSVKGANAKPAPAAKL